MRSYQPYPDYKASGVEWLDFIPTSWNVSKVKYVAPFQVGWTPPTKIDANFIGDNLWANISDLQGKYLSDTAKKISDEAAEAASMEISPKGSLLYSFKLSVGSVSFATKNMYTNEAIATFLEGAGLPLTYMYYALPKFIIQNASTNIYGARILNQELISNAFLLTPPYNDAVKIADFLDHETAKIDSLIEKQQQLITLLKEKRQAVISHAVTKGLNPDAPMRDSGVEWLGEVPEEWIICRVKNTAKLESGHTPDRKKDEYWVNCTIPWVSLNDTSQLRKVNYIAETFYYLNEKGIENSSARLLPERCVVFTRDASIGLAAITMCEMAVSQHIIAWVCNKNKVIPEYLLLVFYAMENELNRYTFGSTLKTIGMPDVNKLSGAFPCVHEQQAIVEHVFSEMERFDHLIGKAKEFEKIILERRGALISAAVTGKIDVRNWQAPTPTANKPDDKAEAA